MGKEIKSITAKEAREISDTSNYSLKHIYKVIRERAEENITELEWCTYGMSKAALKAVMAQLKDDGFEAKLPQDENSLVIKW